MKEIIYLDTENVNSLLAQLGGGIIKDFSEEESSSVSQGTSTTSDNGISNSFEVDLKLLKAKQGGSESEGEMSSNGVTEGQKDLLNKQFHDYSLDILMMKLKNENLIKESDIQEGDLIQSEGEFDFYDFSLINKAANAKTFEEIMKLEDSEVVRNVTEEQAEKIHNKVINNRKLTVWEERHKKEAIDYYEKITERNKITKVMEGLELVSSTTNKLFENLVLIKTGSFIGLLKKEFLRESTESLSFRGKNSRKVKFLGRAIGVKDDVVDESTSFDFSPNELNRIPNILLDILLGSFGILKDGDALISPIAVYYESN